MGNAADKVGVAQRHVSPDTHVSPRASITRNACPVAVSVSCNLYMTLSYESARRKQPNNHSKNHY